MIMSWSTTLQSVREHRWFSGRMLACHAGGPGSIPGRCNQFCKFSKTILVLCFWSSQLNSLFVHRTVAQTKTFGDGGYRSPYLSHAKRALYHLSYVPICTHRPVKITPHSGLERISGTSESARVAQSVER